MKKILIGILAGVSIALVLSFKSIHEQKPGTAQAQKIDGIYVFTDCKPSAQYDILGDVHIKTISSVYYYDKARNNLIVQAKEKFSNIGAEGIIITFPMENKITYQAQVIRFKKQE